MLDGTKGDVSVMTPATCAENIFSTLDFAVTSSKDSAFIRKIKALREKIEKVFNNFSGDMIRTRNQIKKLVYSSDLYQGAKQKIMKLLNKVHWFHHPSPSSGAGSASGLCKIST